MSDAPDERSPSALGESPRPARASAEEPRLLRLDFAPPGAQCRACNRPLVYAHVVVVDGVEGLYGHDCAAKVLLRRPKSGTIPDLTRGAIDPDGEPRLGRDRAEKASDESADPAVREALAVEYLLLRMRTIPSVLGPALTNRRIAWPLLGYALKYYDGAKRLKPRHVAQILSAMSSNRENYPALSYANLLDVYAAASLLTFELHKATRPASIEFFKGLLSKLGRNLCLSPAQIERMTQDQHRGARVRVAPTATAQAFAWEQGARTRKGGAGE